MPDERPARRLAVLRYRKIGPLTEEDWLTTTAIPEERFRSQMGTLRRHRWIPLGMEEFRAALENPVGLPERAVLLTFEGVYRSFLERVLPNLVRYRYPAVAFVAPDIVGETASIHGGMDEPEPICDWDDLRSLRSEMVTIGSLGRTGRSLSDIGPSDLESEITGSKGRLQKELGGEVELFAYPEGDPGEDPDRTVRTLRVAGYRAAFLADGGPASVPPENPFSIPRISMSPGTDLAKVLPGDPP
ncbi:MAG: polysaccharide deacetylase family protein [Gemmatimonadota bacterium]|nr:polysaccharide deacetylase family protein [Gemmatimonadota bacterium]